MINMEGIQDAAYVEENTKKSREILDEIEKETGEILEGIRKRLGES